MIQPIAQFAPQPPQAPFQGIITPAPLLHQPAPLQQTQQGIQILLNQLLTQQQACHKPAEIVKQI